MMSPLSRDPVVTLDSVTRDLLHLSVLSGTMTATSLLPHEFTYHEDQILSTLGLLWRGGGWQTGIEGRLRWSYVCREGMECEGRAERKRGSTVEELT